MKSYLKYLEDKAEGCNIPLLAAFKQADVPTSTYYRTINLVSELRYETASKVSNAIEYLHKANEMREHAKKVGPSKRKNISIRSKFKA